MKENVNFTYCSYNHLNWMAVLFLEKEIRGAHDKCYNCNKVGHFAEYCPNDEVSEETQACYRCGYLGHYVIDCYSKRDIGGNSLDH